MDVVVRDGPVLLASRLGALPGRESVGRRVQREESCCGCWAVVVVLPGGRGGVKEVVLLVRSAEEEDGAS